MNVCIGHQAQYTDFRSFRTDAHDVSCFIRVDQGKSIKIFFTVRALKWLSRISELSRTSGWEQLCGSHSIGGHFPIFFSSPRLLHVSWDIQWCGSMAFWCGSECGSGSADPCLWPMDPDPAQVANKKIICLFKSFFAYYFLNVHLHHFQR